MSLIRRSLMTLGLLIVNQSLLLAQEGLRYLGDLNGDGIADRLESLSLSHFGNGGGPFILTLSAPNGPKQFDVYGYGTFAAEMVDTQTFRLWSYSRTSATSGSLRSFTINKGTMIEETLTINPGDGGTELGNSIFTLIFNGKHRIIAERVQNFTPPPGPASGGVVSK